MPSFDALFSEPLHKARLWKPRHPRRDELSLAQGIRLPALSEDLFGGGIEVAWSDFQNFLKVQGIFEKRDGVPILLSLRKGTARRRTYVSISKKGIKLSADTPEGLRKALVWLEDEMLARGGPFLPFGRRQWNEAITTRISRCFYGPIHRPPHYRNELADDIDYYPEEYLNRLAHDGVTALWITIKFRESVPSVLFPELGKNAELHLAKLRRTVEKCARYGIRIYVFCIEPAALSADSPLFDRYPDLRGAAFAGLNAFCTESLTGRAYVVEAARTLFHKVPGLGGLIVIPVGEHFTNCASVFPEVLAKCPRCSKVGRDRVIHNVMAAFRQGLDESAPGAELIAWPYSQMICWGPEGVKESASHFPEGVVLQHNYESGGIATQLGKPRPLWDYWLSWAGISPLFKEAAHRTQQRGGRMSAKLQVGNSHENATVPFIPVPGLLYRKYRALHEMGVTAVMQSWYFGNYPSLMTRAAGLLSYTPIPKSESEFLTALAGREWGEHAPMVAKAWQCFARGYENFPATHVFSYYGPVQNGLTWPLYLTPRRAALSPTWQSDYPISGDYLPHCFSRFFTLQELITLCTRMTREWQKGCRFLDKAYRSSVKHPTQKHEWNITHAIRMQFETAVSILKFYAFREKLADSTLREDRLKLMQQMSRLVKEEIRRRRRFIPLLEQEPTLGYHSEAEDFMITVQRVTSSITQLETLLSEEFPEMRKEVDAPPARWFAAYTGRDPKISLRIEINRFRRVASALDWAGTSSHPLLNWVFSDSVRAVTHEQSVRGRPSRILPVSGSFRMLIEAGQLCLRVQIDAAEQFFSQWKTSLELSIEPSRMTPRIRYTLDADGSSRGVYEEGYFPPHPEFHAEWGLQKDGRLACLRIPMQAIPFPSRVHAFRFNLSIRFVADDTAELRELSWACREPMKPRLIWDDQNPASDYGWASIV